jgi:diguanylate cyclase (GGDEF)-like protein/PAS domain S-box-containing protein
MSAIVLLVHALGVELMRNDRRWQAALQVAGIGVAEWNLNGELGYTSPLWRRMLGDIEGQHTAVLQNWMTRVHPDDREPLGTAIDALVAQPQEDLERQVRLRTGTYWTWYAVRFFATERDSSGVATRLIVTLQDIQAQRGADERQRLSRSLFENVSEGVLIADADLRVVEVNSNYCAMMGLEREALIGTVPVLLQATAPDALTRNQQVDMWASLRVSGHWSGEVRERRRSGEACVLQVTVFTLPNAEGGVRHHVLMVSDVTESRAQRERLERQANFDELTRLPNRTRLTQMLVQAMNETEREGNLLTLCYLDLDNFRRINEQFGRETGDRLLVELASRLRSTLRAHASWADAAGRLGGDEFVLLMRAHSIDESRLAVERVKRVVAMPYNLNVGAGPVSVTASIGATVYPLDRSDADTLIRHADHAMYAAKQTGRNATLMFDLEHSRRAEERVMAIGRVQEALDRQELMLHYQPKVDLRRGVVLGFEALLRWNHPDQGVVAPAHFLPLIEHTGLSARVGDWVLAQALTQLDQWQQAGMDLSVSVNVSARHLQEPDFAQRLAELLARHERPLGPRLELEVLETAALADIGFTSALLERCAVLGVRFALDDFGTGYSTLTYLKRLPVQVLKIDRSFVHNMLEDPQDRAIVEGVVSLSRTFDCVAVAEGVETPAQARVLLELGCDIGQGSGIAPPMPAADVPRFVRDWRGLFPLAAAG